MDISLYTKVLLYLLKVTFMINAFIPICTLV